MVNFLFSSQRHSAISRLPVMLCLIYSQKIWCANKAANIIAGSPCSCSACTSSLNHAWRCAEHTSPNQNGFMVTTFWERYTRGANLGNLGIKLTAVARNVWQLYRKQAHSNAGTLQSPSIDAQKRRQSFAQSSSLWCKLLSHVVVQPTFAPQRCQFLMVRRADFLIDLCILCQTHIWI